MVDINKAVCGDDRVCNAMKVMQADKAVNSDLYREVYDRLRKLELCFTVCDDVREIKETLKNLTLTEAERKGERKVTLMIGRGVLFLFAAGISWVASNLYFSGGK
jgi:hypothetical protein